ncbi:hypothetical protein COCON_G00030770 [Conger conger]|uniref:Pleckstrin homology domain-containing protein n=1 Tax=Conger conger TaxID=82655 RepID=A0A9Q1DYP9_CONCO|nr:hypothetical protein COCON_G00030770 [Conger conger]
MSGMEEENEAAKEWKSLVRMNEQDRGGDGKLQTFGKRGRAVKRDPNCPVVIRGWLCKQAVHQGMRSYIFSADTQEDMLGWVRALSQSACMEMESSLNRRCSSYQDFTRIRSSSESLDLPETPAVRNGPTQLRVHSNGSQNEASPLVGGRMGTPQLEQRGKQRSMRQSPSPRTSTPTNSAGQSRRRQSHAQEAAEQDSLPLNYPHQTPPQTMKSTGSAPLTPKGQLGSRPHTPVGRVDIRPQDDLLLTPQSIGSAPPSPRLDFSPCSLTPTPEKRHTLNRPTPGYSSPHPISTARRAAGKPATSDLFQERDQQQLRTPESEVDEMERVWSQYERMESELSVLRSHLQHICRFGRPQEQSQAQRELWMMEDILCGLKANRNLFRNMLRLPRQIVASPILQKSVLHPGAPGSQTDGLQNDASMELQGIIQDREVEQGWLESESELEGLYGGLSPHHRSEQFGDNPSVLSRDRKLSDTMPGTVPGLTASNWSTPDTTIKRVRMSEEEQRERIKRNQERLANQKKAPTSSPTNHSQSQQPSPPREEPPFPLRVTRVLTAVLPSALVARHLETKTGVVDLLAMREGKRSEGAPPFWFLTLMLTLTSA